MPIVVGTRIGTPDKCVTRFSILDLDDHHGHYNCGLKPQTDRDGCHWNFYISFISSSPEALNKQIIRMKFAAFTSVLLSSDLFFVKGQNTPINAPKNLFLISSEEGAILQCDVPIDRYDYLCRLGSVR